VSCFAKGDYWNQPFEYKLELLDYLISKLNKETPVNKTTEPSFGVEKTFLGYDSNKDEYWFIAGKLTIEDPISHQVKCYYSTKSQFRDLIRYLQLKCCSELLENLKKRSNEIIACMENTFALLIQGGDSSDEFMTSENEPDTSDIPPLFSFEEPGEL